MKRHGDTEKGRRGEVENERPNPGVPASLLSASPRLSSSS